MVEAHLRAALKAGISEDEFWRLTPYRLAMRLHAIGRAQIEASLYAGWFGGALTAWVQRPSRRAVDAAAARDESTGEAAVITSLATAFTGTTASMREEIDRLQIVLNDLRTRVVEAEAEIRAAALREADQARIIADLREQLEVSHADVVRLRAERDTALASTTQKEGEVRQLKAVIDAHARATT